MAVNLLAEMSDGWYIVFEESITLPQLDRDGVSVAVANMLKSDSTLYGTTTASLLQIIEGDPKKFSKAKVNAKRQPYGLYLWAEASDSVSIRSQNKDVLFGISMRFEGLNIDTTAGMKVVEDAYNRAMLLIDKQMWDGQLLTGYYTDSTATLINMESVGSTFPAPETGERGFFATEIEGAATVEINRFQ